jgi:hypothetical protein
MAKERGLPYIKCRHLKCRKVYATIEVPKIDLERHRIIAELYGPPSITNADKQLKNIAKACLASGVTLAIGPAIVTAPVPSVSVAAIESGVKACLAAQNAGAQLVEPDFEVRIYRRDNFEH